MIYLFNKGDGIERIDLNDAGKRNGEKMLKYLKCRRGEAILSFIVIVAVVAILGAIILPPFGEAIGNRVDKTIDNYNGTDTIVTYD